MSTTPTEPIEEQPSQEPHDTETPAEQPTPEQQPPAQETDWKAEARKWEALAKKHKAAAEKLDEIEEASKTEAQKQAERMAKLEAKVKDYETREQIAAWAKEVSEETGVPAEVLSGSTKEELEAHAAKLKPLIGQAQQPEPPSTVPTIGKTPATPPNVPLSEQIAAAEREVQTAERGSPEYRAALDKVMQLKGMQLREAANK